MFLSVIVAHCTNSFGQGNTMYPIAPNNYVHTCTIDNENINVNYPGNIYLGSSNSNMLGAGSFNVLGNSQVVIKAKAINLKDTHLKSDNNNGTHLSARSTNIACNYSTTNGFPDVPIYEKIEYGLDLPEEIQAQIDLFLNSNTSAASVNHPGLNPYDPEDISIEATVTADINDAHFSVQSTIPNNPSIQTFKVYGFYYQEAAASADLTSWTVNTHTPYPFRVRIAPPFIGNYTVEFSVKYKTSAGYNTLSLSGFMCGNYTGPMAGLVTVNFNAVANTSGKAIAKGYLEVGQHKRHLRHSYDNSSFFPIGMNLPELPEPPGFTWIGQSPFHKYTPWGYNERRNNYFASLASNHGNFVRMISFSDVNAIERTGGSYEYHIGPSSPTAPEIGVNLGNYQVNQKHMQETDYDITKMEELGIFANFCLLIHYPFENKYDWKFDDWEHNAYRIELGLSSVKDFFSNPTAQRYFKNKLRYAQARWGYSPAIGMWQLASEISQFGLVAMPGIGPYFSNSNLYDQDHVEKLFLWQCLMTNYLKSIYPNHLTNTCYALNPFSNYYGTTGNNPACVDKSFTCTEMDIISWNDYNFDGAQSKNRDRFEAVHDIIYDPSNDQCLSDPKGYFIDKPLLFTEVGNNYNYPAARIAKCTDIDVHNQMWAGAMSGELGTPLEWHENTDLDALNSFFSNYNALSSFFDDVDFEAHKYTPCVKDAFDLIDPNGEPDPLIHNNTMLLEIYVMANDNSGIGEKSDRGFGWVNHLEGNWASQTQGFMNGACSGPPTTDEIDLIDERTYNYKLNGFKAGNYLIDVYDTRTGNIIHSSNSNNDIHASIANILTLGIPLVDLYKNPYTERLDYAFKFWHASLNGNDLRIITPQDSSNNNNTSVILPGDNDDLKKYFLVDYYPNPSAGYITVVATGESIQSISLLDLAGKVVRVVDNLNSHKIEFNFEGLALGLYNLKVTSNSGISKIFKLVKQ